MENKFVGFHEHEGYRGEGSTEVSLYQKRISDVRFDFMRELLGRWGMVAAITDGEDSAGRQRLRLGTIEETITRAFEMADGAIAEAERRGWFLELPEPKLAKPREKTLKS